MRVDNKVVCLQLVFSAPSGQKKIKTSVQIQDEIIIIYLGTKKLSTS